jgi:hypothetical protein
VEAATHADHLLALARQYGGNWVSAWESAYGLDAAHRAIAEAGVVDRSRHYHLALTDPDIGTRLGDPPIDVDVIGNLASPFGQGRIDVLPVPARWLIRAGVGPLCQATAIRVVHGSTELAIEDGTGAALAVTYSKEGLHGV